MKKMIALITGIISLLVSSSAMTAFAASNADKNPATGVSSIVWVLIVVAVAVIGIVLSVIFGKKRK